MERTKCKTCKHYENFFNSCNLYYKEVYLGEGEFDIQSVSIKNINKSECKYEKSRKVKL